LQQKKTVVTLGYCSSPYMSWQFCLSACLFVTFVKKSTE